MDDPETEEQCADLISRLFALITANLEDASAMAALCQGRRPRRELRGRADQLESLILQVATLNAAALALLADDGD